MKKVVKFLFALIVTMATLALTITPGLGAGTPGKVNYVAFGDSVSAGVRGGAFEVRSDKGYTDNLAKMLKNIGILGSFDKDFCISGETAKGLARRTAILTNPSSASAALVKNADIITLDIGANDLLYPFFTYAITRRNLVEFDINTVKQILSQMIDDLFNGTIGTDTQYNIEIILQNILAANCSVNIYVMGYYNPLPTLSSILDLDLNAPTRYFNTLIQKAISDVKVKYPHAAISYVETFDAMAASSENLIAKDIHPTELGHVIISGEFWKQIRTLEAINQADAMLSSSHFTINDIDVPLRAYIINSNNFVKIRDLAMVLNGTEKQFGIYWDSAADVVTITTGKTYSPVGGELTPLSNSNVTRAKLSDSLLILDGKKLSLTGYTIDENNYIKLRDLTAALNIGVTWSSGSNTVTLYLNKSYEPPLA